MIAPGSVKICGLRIPGHAGYVVSAEADLFGLIFVESAWRYVTPQQGRSIVSEARTQAGATSIGAVGVFLNSAVDEINRIAEIVGLDYVQIHVSDRAIAWEQIERPVIVALRPEPGKTQEQISNQMASIRTQSQRIASFFVDAWHPTLPGGAGAVGDWKLTHDLASHHACIMAGGLTPENVAEGIRVVQPIAVDVSSGVETDREKDPAKIRAFVRNARQAFSDLLIRQVDDVPVG